MWAFIMGLLLGVLIGFFAMGLCMAAGTEDDDGSN